MSTSCPGVLPKKTDYFCQYHSGISSWHLTINMQQFSTSKCWNAILNTPYSYGSQFMLSEHDMTCFVGMIDMKRTNRTYIWGLQKHTVPTFLLSICSVSSALLPDYRAASFLRLWHSSIHHPHFDIKKVYFHAFDFSWLLISSFLFCKWHKEQQQHALILYTNLLTE